MKRYLTVLLVFYKAALLADLEYRANFLTNIVLSLVSATWALAGIAVYFQHTDSIGTWTFPELLIVLGLFLFYLGLIDAILTPNVKDFIEHIRHGTMDFILIKPINAQFHTSLRRINIWRLIDLLIGAGFVFYGLFQLAQRPTLGHVLTFLLLCLCAVLIMYALIMLLITSAFWFVQLENIVELLFTFYDAGRFPVTIFPNWLRVILTFVVPIAFVTTIPATALLGRIEPLFVGYSVGITAVLFTACIAFWQYAIRHYSSASS